MFRQFPFFGVTAPLPPQTSEVEIDYSNASTVYFVDPNAVLPGKVGDENRPFATLEEVHELIAERTEDNFTVIQKQGERQEYSGFSGIIPNKSISYHGVRFEYSNIYEGSATYNITQAINRGKIAKYEFFNCVIALWSGGAYFNTEFADLFFFNTIISIISSENITDNLSGENAFFRARAINGNGQVFVQAQLVDNTLFQAGNINFNFSAEIILEQNTKFFLFDNVINGKILIDELRVQNLGSSDSQITILKGNSIADVTFGSKIDYMAQQQDIVLDIVTNETGAAKMVFNDTVIPGTVCFKAGFQTHFKGVFSYAAPDENGYNLGVVSYNHSGESYLKFEDFKGYAGGIKQGQELGKIIVRNSHIKHPNAGFVEFASLFDGSSEIYLEGFNMFESSYPAFRTDDWKVFYLDTWYSMASIMEVDIIAVCPNSVFRRKFNHELY